MTPTRETGLLLLGLLLAGSTTGAAAQDRNRGLEPAVQMASATPFTVERGLGSPIVFSRTDVESPLARIRTWNSDPASSTLGLETETGNATPEVSPLADPAFKSVLLTPRSSTGRPVQPTYEPPPEAPAEAPPPARKEASLPPPHVPQQLRPLPQMRHESAAPATSNPKPRNERSARATSVRPEGPKGSPADIAATRAFTRF